MATPQHAVHGAKLLDIMHGARWPYASCEHPACQASIQFRGYGWNLERFLTAEEAIKRFPDAEYNPRVETRRLH